MAICLTEDHIVGPIVRWEAGEIVREDHVENPVEAVFDAPKWALADER